LTARAPTPSVAPGELTRTAATASPVPAQCAHGPRTCWLQGPAAMEAGAPSGCLRPPPHAPKHSWTKPTPSSSGSRSPPVARVRRSRASTQPRWVSRGPRGWVRIPPLPQATPPEDPAKGASHPRTPNRSKAQLRRPGAAGLSQIRPDPSKWSRAVGGLPLPPRLSPSAFRGWHLILLHHPRGEARHPGSTPAASPPRGAPLVLTSTCSFLACAGRGRASPALEVAGLRSSLDAPAACPGDGLS
jgi:hypothetical protein